MAVDGTKGYEALATALADLARDLLAQETVQATLDRIAAAAVELVDGCEYACLMTLRNGQVVTLASTSERAQTSDRLQAELGEGPCLDAYQRSERVFRFSNLSEAAKRWPQYAPRVGELGIASSMGFLLFTDETNHLGALNLYSSRPGVFTSRSEQVGLLLASHAAVAFAGARHEAQLHEAMLTRQEIGEAVGIVMERYQVKPEAAFAVLSRSSQNSNTKLREVAAEVVRTGEVPGSRAAYPT